MKKQWLAIVIVGVVSVAQCQICPAYSYMVGPFPYLSPENTLDHNYGWHQLAGSQGATCQYSQFGTFPGPCQARADATSHSLMYESGKVSGVLGSIHETAVTDVTSTSTAISPSTATASSEGAGAVRHCLISCSFSIGLSAPYGSMSFSATPVWETRHPYTNTCLARKSYKAPTCSGAANTDGFNPCGPSPILIDTRKQGWHLKDYVTFSFGGVLKKVSFPDPDYENGWLCLPKHGVCNSADDLFGDYSPHSDGGLKGHPNPNGFLALAWYDWPSQGGKLDGVLDKNDAIYKKLRVWFPKHCFLNPDQPCSSLDSELRTLEAVGLDSLSMVYEASDYVDAIGNACSWRSVVNPDASRQKSKDGRWACDFNLKVKP